MKNKLFILLALTAFALPASAVVTVEESTSQEFLMNHGHSKNTAEIIEMQKKQINGIKYVQPVEKEYYNTQPAKFVRQVFKYLDNGLDDGKFMQHDISPTTRYNDL